MWEEFIRRLKNGCQCVCMDNSRHHIIVIPPLLIQRVCLTWKGWTMFPQSRLIRRRRLTQTVDFQVTNKLFFERTVLWDVILYRANGRLLV
jgi:hypothetical protein